jgi:hypothetical protein
MIGRWENNFRKDRQGNQLARRRAAAVTLHRFRSMPFALQGPAPVGLGARWLGRRRLLARIARLRLSS